MFRICGGGRPGPSAEREMQTKRSTSSSKKFGIYWRLAFFGPRNIGGVCDDVANDKRRHLEWFGISGQYDSFGSAGGRGIKWARTQAWF